MESLGQSLRAFCVLPALLVWTTQARAELRWEKTQIELTPSSTASLAPAEFRFTNAGPERITLQEVRPDCGCVLTSIKTQTFEPGESGSIPVVFNVQGQTGDHHVPIAVRTEVGGKPSHATLVLHVRIRDAVLFSERFVYWRPAAPLEPRTIYVTLTPDEGLTIQDVSSDSPAFRVFLEATQNPERFALHIAPPPERGRAVANIVVRTTSSKNPGISEHRVLARVW